MEPKYKHDCDECQYLDRYYEKGVIYDLYVHRRVKAHGDDNDIIARYGDDGPDYMSSSADVIGTNKAELAHIHRPLIEALSRSQEK